jgi:uncharacterized protein with HEPN domain
MALESGRPTWRASSRWSAIASIASRMSASHLPEDVRQRHPEIPWTGVKGMRLWLDHEYHRVDAAVVWRTVTERLPALRRAIEKELHR